MFRRRFQSKNQKMPTNTNMAAITATGTVLKLP